MSQSRATSHESRATALALMLFCASAAAQVMTDPTRPPEGMGAAGMEAAGDAGGGMLLQSVMISPTHKAAIINGVMVRLGDRFGGAVLVKVAESEVVLRSDGTSQVLKLYPGVNKREVAPAAAKSALRRGKARSGKEAAAAGGMPAR